MHLSHHASASILFILRRPDKGSALYTPYHQPSSGLLNSARFVVDLLKARGVHAHLVQVTDSNDIDREVMRLNPDVVMLEAIWVPPAKLKELTALKRHAHRHFVVRNHSKMPFLASEGGVLDWVLTYGSIPHVNVACNSEIAALEIEQLTNRRVAFLPNYYPVSAHMHHHDRNPDTLDIGCFGAIRPLKNHLEQAVAAVLFARQLGVCLAFHINAGRIEGKGEPVLKALRSLFARTPHTHLVEHEWLSHDRFLHLCKTMDLGLQVSFSETFNIVAADLVNEGVPVVGSSQIPWLPEAYVARTTSAFNMIGVMGRALDKGAHEAKRALAEYSEDAADIWTEWLRR